MTLVIAISSMVQISGLFCISEVSFTIGARFIPSKELVAHHQELGSPIPSFWAYKTPGGNGSALWGR